MANQFNRIHIDIDKKVWIRPSFSLSDEYIEFEIETTIYTEILKIYDQLIELDYEKYKLEIKLNKILENIIRENVERGEIDGIRTYSERLKHSKD